MEQKNKWIGLISKVVILILVFFVGFGVGVNYTNDRLELPEETELQTGEVLLSLDFGESRVEEFSGLEVSGPTKVFDLLVAADLDLEYRDFGGDMGVFIESIEGVGKRRGDEGKWWQFWVNGEYAELGVSSVEVTPGDEIEFRFTGDQEDI